jgi:hypothetical protein
LGEAIRWKISFYAVESSKQVVLHSGSTVVRLPMINQEEETKLQKSLPGSLVKALPFLTIIILLGGWSAGFYALQFSSPDKISEGLRCLAFFGGLSAAIILGALIGTFLKRLVLKALLLRRRKQQQ